MDDFKSRRKHFNELLVFEYKGDKGVLNHNKFYFLTGYEHGDCTVATLQDYRDLQDKDDLLYNAILYLEPCDPALLGKPLSDGDGTLVRIRYAHPWPGDRTNLDRPFLGAYYTSKHLYSWSWWNEETSWYMNVHRNGSVSFENQRWKEYGFKPGKHGKETRLVQCEAKDNQMYFKPHNIIHTRRSGTTAMLLSDISSSQSYDEV